MTPFRVTLSPVAANLTGFLSNATGATWTLTATSSADDMAHKVTIRNDSATDHSGKTATLVGTSPNGRAQTESLALPGSSATVTSTLYWRTLTSVTPSATIGTDTMDIGWTAESVSKTMPINGQASSQAQVSVDITGTVTYELEATPDNPYQLDDEDVVWIDFISSGSADAAGHAGQGSQAIRAHVTAVTSTPTIQISVAQGK